MKDKTLPFSVILALAIALSFLSRGVYWFYKLILNGGVNLREPNLGIALFEFIMIIYSLFILSIYFFSSLLNFSINFWNKK